MKDRKQDRHKEGYHKEYYIKNKKRRLNQNKKWKIKNKDRRREWVRKHYIKNAVRMKRDDRKYNLKTNYNLTLEQYNEMFKKQKGKCAICEKHQSELKVSLHVDHNHTTGQNRGLLCHKCNFGLGLFAESIELFDKAKQYIKSF